MGPWRGNTCRVDDAVYVFFEKLRPKQGKKKSKARVETEKRWEREGGIQRDRVTGNIHKLHLSAGSRTGYG